MRTKRLLACWLVLGVIASGCGAPSRDPASSGAPRQSAADSQRLATPKRLTMALKDDVPGLSDKVRVGPGGGIMVAEHLVNAGLGIADGNGVIQPQAAEQVPSLENGLWKLNPDG